MKTLQETFNELLIHMRALNGPAVNDEGTCIYRFPNGEAGCPVGRMIPNHLYKEEMEENVATHDIIAAVLESEGHNVELCQLVQFIHDEKIKERWEDCMNVLAKAINLNYYIPLNHTPIEGLENITYQNMFDLPFRYRWPNVDINEVLLRLKIRATDEKRALKKLELVKV